MIIVVIITILFFFRNWIFMSQPIFATQGALKRCSGNANEMAITAINSPRKIEKPTDKQAAPIIVERQVAIFSYSSLILAILLPQLLKNIKNRNVFCYTQFCAIFFDTKLLALCVCTFSQDEMSIPEHSHQPKLPTIWKSFYKQIQHLIHCRKY